MGNSKSLPCEIPEPDGSRYQVHAAAYGNHIEKLVQMKRSGDDLWKRDEDGRSALHHAVSIKKISRFPQIL